MTAIKPNVPTISNIQYSRTGSVDGATKFTAGTPTGTG